MCTENAKCEKIVLRYIWQDHIEMAVYKELYRQRKEKIERVFADAKEKHSICGYFTLINPDIGEILCKAGRESKGECGFK